MPEVEEDKPEPDLDELLELFREPEKEPRRKKTRGSVWLMAALILSLFGGWMAARVANGAAAKLSAPGPPVLPTKVSDRKPREEQAVGVVENYIARCKKGMTEREVRWIIEDFQKAGLAQGLRNATPEEFIRPRKAQHAWYLDLLEDGLRLDPDQRRTAKEKLASLLEEAVVGFQKELSEQASAPIEQDGRRLQVVSAEVVNKLIEANQWLTDERYAPWELCELTDEQKRMTWYFYVMDRRSGEPGGYYDPEYPWWNPETCSISDPEDEKGWSIGDFSTGCGPDKIGAAASVFPFISSQKFSNLPEGLSGPADVQAESCHPAQLKTALLVDPKIASSLLEAIGAADK